MGAVFDTYGGPDSQGSQQSLAKDLSSDASRQNLSGGLRNTAVLEPVPPPTDSGYGSAIHGKSGQPSGLEMQGDYGQIPEADETRTLYSDASSIAPGNAEYYVYLLADELFNAARSVQPDIRIAERVSDILPELLRAFALRIGHNASDQKHRDVMVYVHKYRR